MSSNHYLIESWRECNLELPPFLFPGDKLELIESVSSTYRNFEDYVASIEFGSSSAKLHLGLLPIPYVGDGVDPVKWTVVGLGKGAKNAQKPSTLS